MGHQSRSSSTTVVVQQSHRPEDGQSEDSVEYRKGLATRPQVQAGHRATRVAGAGGGTSRAPSASLTIQGHRGGEQGHRDLNGNYDHSLHGTTDGRAHFQPGDPRRPSTEAEYSSPYKRDPQTTSLGRPVDGPNPAESQKVEGGEGDVKTLPGKSLQSGTTSRRARSVSFRERSSSPPSGSHHGEEPSHTSQRSMRSTRASGNNDPDHSSQSMQARSAREHESTAQQSSRPAGRSQGHQSQRMTAGGGVSQNSGRGGAANTQTARPAPERAEEESEQASIEYAFVTARSVHEPYPDFESQQSTPGQSESEGAAPPRHSSSSRLVQDPASAAARGSTNTAQSRQDTACRSRQETTMPVSASECSNSESAQDAPIMQQTSRHESRRRDTNTSVGKHQDVTASESEDMRQTQPRKTASRQQEKQRMDSRTSHAVEEVRVGSIGSRAPGRNVQQSHKGVSQNQDLITSESEDAQPTCRGRSASRQQGPDVEHRSHHASQEQSRHGRTVGGSLHGQDFAASESEGIEVQATCLERASSRQGRQDMERRSHREDQAASHCGHTGGGSQRYQEDFTSESEIVQSACPPKLSSHQERQDTTQRTCHELQATSHRSQPGGGSRHGQDIISESEVEQSVCPPRLSSRQERQDTTHRSYHELQGNSRHSQPGGGSQRGQDFATSESEDVQASCPPKLSSRQERQDATQRSSKQLHTDSRHSHPVGGSRPGQDFVTSESEDLQSACPPRTSSRQERQDITQRSYHEAQANTHCSRPGGGSRYDQDYVTSENEDVVVQPGGSQRASSRQERQGDIHRSRLEVQSHHSSTARGTRRSLEVDEDCPQVKIVELDLNVRAQVDGLVWRTGPGDCGAWLAGFKAGTPLPKDHQLAVGDKLLAINSRTVQDLPRKQLKTTWERAQEEDASRYLVLKLVESDLPPR